VDLGDVAAVVEVEFVRPVGFIEVFVVALVQAGRVVEACLQEAAEGGEVGARLQVAEHRGQALGVGGEVVGRAAWHRPV